MPLTRYPATKDPLSWINRSSVRSRTFNCSHSGGWANDFSYCSVVNGIANSLVLDVFANQFPVPLQRRVNVRLGVEQHPVQQIPTLLAVLEEHQSRHTQDGHQVLQHHIHRQAEHLAVQEPAADVHHHPRRYVARNDHIVYTGELREGQILTVGQGSKLVSNRGSSPAQVGPPLEERL